MLLFGLLLLPAILASTVTVYIHPVPASAAEQSSIIPSPVPLAQIDYDAVTSIGTVTSYTPPKGSYAADHLLRIGLYDATTASWRGVVTSAASFAEQYSQQYILHVDELGQVFHVGFAAIAKKDSKGQEAEVDIMKRSPGPKPVLNKPVVVNADGKVDEKEPEKTFLQKYWWAIAAFIVVQLLASGGKE